MRYRYGFMAGIIIYVQAVHEGWYLIQLGAVLLMAYCYGRTMP